jgi:hypothetical protein
MDFFIYLPKKKGAAMEPGTLEIKVGTYRVKEKP